MQSTYSTNGHGMSGVGNGRENWDRGSDWQLVRGAEVPQNLYMPILKEGRKSTAKKVSIGGHGGQFLFPFSVLSESFCSS